MNEEKNKEGKLSRWWRKLRSNTKMAVAGVGIVMRRPTYVVIAVVVFLFFAYLFAFFQDGDSNWSLLWSKIDFGRKMGMVFGVWGQVVANFVDLWGLVLLILSGLQGLCVALLVYSVRRKVSREAVASGAEAGGVGVAIGLVALGCPACGTSLLTPVLTMLLGSSAMAFVGTIGYILSVGALLLLVFAAWKLGYGIYLDENGICKKKRRKRVAKD